MAPRRSWRCETSIPFFEVIAQFAQLLLDHRDELDDYQDELRRLGYWIVYGHFDRQAVNRRLAAYAATCTGEEQEVSLFDVCTSRMRRNLVASIAAKIITKLLPDCHR